MIEATLKDVKEKHIEKIRLSSLLEPNGIMNFDTMYPFYSSMLPPLDQMQISEMPTVTYFTNPNQWILQDCMTNLL